MANESMEHVRHYAYMARRLKIRPAWRHEGLAGGEDPGCAARVEAETHGSTSAVTAFQVPGR
jgi:hypothetical protein